MENNEMNVGWLPGMTLPYGFIIVMGLMVTIAAVEFWYFKQKGWFD
jgi:Mg2+ and Co2+ transporter CorA